MKEDDIKRLRIGSLVQYTHFGRHETTKATGIVVELMVWEFRGGTLSLIHI